MEKLTWTDNAGRTWSNRITLEHARRLKDNGTDLLDPQMIEPLFSDTLKIVETIAELTRPQWAGNGFDYVAFADVLIETPEVYQSASEAFKAGIVDFFRRLAKPALAELVERAFAAASETEQSVMSRVKGEQMDRLIQTAQRKAEREFDAAVESEIAKITGEPSGSLLASSV